MCIIVYKPAGVSMPSDEILKNCEEANSDGIGAMWIDENGVGMYKENTTLDKFMGALPKKDWKAIPVAIHFRWATHGKVCDELCHPFNIHEEYSELVKTSAYVKAGFMHNGILPITVRDTRLSDTAVFVQSHLVKLLDKIHNLGEVEQSLIEFIMGSDKGVLFTDAGVIYTFGKFIEDDGIFYSNTGYLSSPVWRYSRFDRTSFKSKSGKDKTDFFDYEKYMDEDYFGGEKNFLTASGDDGGGDVDQCIECSDWDYVKNMHKAGFDGEYICELCYSNMEMGLVACENCGELDYEQDLEEINGKRYCYQCISSCEICDKPLTIEMLAVKEDEETGKSLYLCHECNGWITRYEKKESVEKRGN